MIALVACWLGWRRKLSPSTPTSRLTPAEGQLVEIARAAFGGLPGPDHGRTDDIALDNGRSSGCFEARGPDLKSKGIGIVFVSHWLEEVFRIADRITVLRDSKFIGTRPAAELDHEKVIKMMVGRDVAEVTTWPGNQEK